MNSSKIRLSVSFIFYSLNIYKIVSLIHIIYVRILYKPVVL